MRPRAPGWGWGKRAGPGGGGKVESCRDVAQQCAQDRQAPGPRPAAVLGTDCFVLLFSPEDVWP